VKYTPTGLTVSRGVASSPQEIIFLTQRIVYSLKQCNVIIDLDVHILLFFKHRNIEYYYVNMLLKMFFTGKEETPPCPIA
jgi:hypothetical protein